jgi:hypothetical protein
MSQLKLEIDMEHLNAKMRPAMVAAVDEVLAGIDLKAKVIAALNEEVQDGLFGMFKRTGSGPSVVDSAIRRVLQEEIDKFVRKHVFAHKDFLEDALLKAIRNSEQKLTKAFVKAMLDAVDDQTWKFDLSMRLEAKACD